MTGLFTLVGFAAKLGAIERDMHEIGPSIIRAACAMVAASLDAMRTNMQAELSKLFADGADIPTAVALFIKAILARKREIEAGASALGASKPN